MIETIALELRQKAAEGYRRLILTPGNYGLYYLRDRGLDRLDVPVDICLLVDTKCIYRVGTGRLVHDETGFTLTGCEGRLRYHQSPAASYSLYADYFWYELGDMICIGDSKTLYYCFPQTKGDLVAKTRLAAETLYERQRKS